MPELAIRVVVADDQNAVREGLVALLGTMDGVQVVGEAADGRDAVRLALLKRADGEGVRPSVCEAEADWLMGVSRGVGLRSGS